MKATVIFKTNNTVLNVVSLLSRVRRSFEIQMEMKEISTKKANLT